MDDDVRLLRGLVTIPSPTGSTDKAVRFLVEEMRQRGFEAEVDGAGNAIGTVGRGAREILLVGHVDTVPGDLPVRLDGGVLWGRGSVDAKGPLAAFVAAASRFARDERVRVTVVGCLDEEAESEGAKHLLTTHPRPEALVIGEPSGTDGVTIGYKGIVKIRYVVEEDLAHTGAPFPSVPDRGIAFWTAIQAYLAPLHGASLFDTPTVKLSSFDTRLLPSGRHRVELVGSARIPPGFDAAAFCAFLRERQGTGAVTVAEVDPAWVSDKNAAVARAFVASVRATGLVPRYVKKTGTSDMNILAPKWDVPCVAYGPGDASLDHTPHERLALDDYARAIRVLEGAIRRLADG